MRMSADSPMVPWLAVSVTVWARMSWSGAPLMMLPADVEIVVGPHGAGHLPG